MLITVGFEQPSEEMMSEWVKWFESIGDKMAEQVGLMNGIEVTESELTELAMDKDALTGYLIIEAENKEEAIKIAQDCPMITSTLVYEVRGE